MNFPELVEVRVNVWPVNRKLDLGGYFPEFHHALMHASTNLYSKSGIIVDTERDSVIYDGVNGYYITMKVPKNIMNGESIDNLGGRLKGISWYLLHKTETPYKKYCVGTRLLNYRIVY